MKFFSNVLVLALATDVLATTAIGKFAYNKWHETELERWLSDHNVPFPTASDRADLIDLVNKNWEDNVVSPYHSWDIKQLTSYLSTQGQKMKKGTEQNKDSLVAQVKSAWHETGDQASGAYASVQDWIFDSWTDSQLKSFLDYNSIPNPSPRTRDSLLSTARSNYQSAANKVGETVAYPGNWLYTSWSDSDLKAWLDERGLPAPQPNSRDKLVASVRRNSRIASNKASAAASSASLSAASAQKSVTDQLYDAWKETDFQKWFKKHNIDVPQGANLKEMRAFASQKSSSMQASGSSAYGAATTSAGNAYAQATDGLYAQGKDWYNWALNQAGMADETVRASLSSASVAASVSASSLARTASSSSSSLSSVASVSSSSLSKAAASASSSASKSAVKAGDDGAKAARDAASSVSASGSSAARVAASSASSAAKVASASASSVAKSLASKAAASTKSFKAEL